MTAALFPPGASFVELALGSVPMIEKLIMDLCTFLPELVRTGENFIVGGVPGQRGWLTRRIDDVGCREVAWRIGREGGSGGFHADQPTVFWNVIHGGIP